jgi:hypothetical protein
VNLVRGLPSRIHAGTLLSLVSLALALGVVVTSVATLDLPAGVGWVLLAYTAVIAFGEMNRIVLPGARETAPMSLAAGFALAMTSDVGGQPFMVGAAMVMAVTAVGMLVGTLPTLLRRRP